MLHQEADGVAVLATTKAVIELFGGADAEGGRFFTMKGAQPHEIGATLLELHIAAHDVHHVNAREQFLDERLGDRHPGILNDPARAPEPQGLRLRRAR